MLRHSFKALMTVTNVVCRIQNVVNADHLQRTQGSVLSRSCCTVLRLVWYLSQVSGQA